MPPLPRFVVPFLAWGVFAADAAAAPATAAGERSAWVQLFSAAPATWAVLAVSAILAAALIAHLGYVLSDRNGVPRQLVEVLKHAMDAGNYQEAWETCGRWWSACLARVLQPALEKIGRGRERVEEALVLAVEKERKLAAILSWSLLGVGVGLPLLCGFAGWSGLGSLFRADQTASDPRTLTLAMGELVLIAAAAFAIAATSLIFWILLRGTPGRLFDAASMEAGELVKDLAYEDLEGLRIGAEFAAGTLLGDAEARPSGKLRVSRELTTACPACNGPINPSRNPCPHCGVPFEWS
ncbi:MAG: hypothetical protein PHC88_04620 [Terrimicrobiaceae bacterium]|nr:hypothetical protein [Terrimicrobiaceae bacterium]